MKYFAMAGYVLIVLGLSQVLAALVREVNVTAGHVTAGVIGGSGGLMVRFVWRKIGEWFAK